MRISEINVGDWISDTAGVYEVIELREDGVCTQEVTFGDGDDYTLGDKVIKTKSDLVRCKKGA